MTRVRSPPMTPSKRTRTTAPSTPTPPYTYDSAAKEIQAFIDRHPRGTLTRLAAASDMSTQNFRHCLNQQGRDDATGKLGVRFSIEEIGEIALEASAIEGIAHIGPWPFCTWEEAVALTAVRKMLASRK